MASRQSGWASITARVGPMHRDAEAMAPLCAALKRRPDARSPREHLRAHDQHGASKRVMEKLGFDPCNSAPRTPASVLWRLNADAYADTYQSELSPAPDGHASIVAMRALHALVALLCFEAQGRDRASL